MRKLIDVAAALAGGMLGTWLLQRSLPLAARLPEPIRPTDVTADPAKYFVDKGQQLIGRPLPARLEKALRGSLGCAYGATGPLALGLLAARIGRHSTGRLLAAGAAMGAVIWAVGYLGWLPATGLAKPIHKNPVGRSASTLLEHLAYGTVSTVPLALTGRYVA
jgi:hypothetical protein